MEYICSFNFWSLSMKSYAVTIQMKPLLSVCLHGNIRWKIYSRGANDIYLRSDQTPNESNISDLLVMLPPPPLPPPPLNQLLLTYICSLQLLTLKCKPRSYPSGGGICIFWVGVCHWDSETLTLYQAMFSRILQLYSRQGTKNPYPTLYIYLIYIPYIYIWEYP